MVTPLPVVPSPKSHAQSSTVPSTSVEALPSKAQVVPPQADENAAEGATLAGTDARKTARPRQSVVASATLDGPLGTPPLNPVRTSRPSAPSTT